MTERTEQDEITDRTRVHRNEQQITKGAGQAGSELAQGRSPTGPSNGGKHPDAVHEPGGLHPGRKSFVADRRRSDRARRDRPASRDSLIQPKAERLS
jgi:hypothetical protein